MKRTSSIAAHFTAPCALIGAIGAGVVAMTIFHEYLVSIKFQVCSVPKSRTAEPVRYFSHFRIFSCHDHSSSLLPSWLTVLGPPNLFPFNQDSSLSAPHYVFNHPFPPCPVTFLPINLICPPSVDSYSFFWSSSFSSPCWWWSFAKFSADERENGCI